MVDTTTIQVKRFPDALWKRVKVRALDTGTTARAILIDALLAYLSRPERDQRETP